MTRGDRGRVKQVLGGLESGDVVALPGWQPAESWRVFGPRGGSGRGKRGVSRPKEVSLVDESGGAECGGAGPAGAEDGRW